MKNRAKCKLCKEIIESFTRHDYVTCKCGEISIDGGQDYLRCRANDFANFLRVDDEGNEITVRYGKEPQKQTQDPVIESLEQDKEPCAPTREEVVKQLDIMIEGIENLPSQAMVTAVTQYDMYSMLLLIKALFKV